MPPMAMPPMNMPPMAMPPMNMPPMMMMPMYFSTNFDHLILLFKAWAPRSEASMALACVAACIAAILDVALRRANVRIEGSLQRSPCRRLPRNMVRAAMVAVSSTLSYLLMLLAMTFNVQIFCSIIGGFVVGTLCFGHWSDADGANDGLDHIARPLLNSISLSDGSSATRPVTVNLRVEGMVCDDCRVKVHCALCSVSGVRCAMVDLAERRAVVTGQVTAQALLAAVESTGKQASVIPAAGAMHGNLASGGCH